MKVAIEKLAFSDLKLTDIFSKISKERGAVWLDSSLKIGDKGGHSFIARNPKVEIVAGFDSLEVSLEKLAKLICKKSLFTIGYMSYESTLPFIGITPDKQRLYQSPLFHFLVYDSVFRLDHQSGRASATNPDADNYSDLIECPELNQSGVKTTSEFGATVAKKDYVERVNSIKEHIREGDIYQANYTCRFDFESNSLPFDVYQNLRNLNPAPYAAYLNFGDYQIISSSPERMFKRNGSHITSAPIKGTVSAGENDLERDMQRRKLLNSAKDKAELLMIVDLMRNDLGKIAETGSVRVSNLFKSEDYSSLIHLVSDITASLREGVDYLDIFKALMPGGSVTGAPKKRAVEILQAHESSPRGVYTGCIGYIYADTADFNIAIRTMIHRNGTYHVHAGGGIVADSDPENEYQEMQLKAKNLFKALGAKAGI